MNATQLPLIEETADAEAVIKSWHKHYDKRPRHIAEILNLSEAALFGILVQSELIISSTEYTEREKFNGYKPGHCQRCGIRVFASRADLPRKRYFIKNSTRSRPIFLWQHHEDCGGYCPSCYPYREVEDTMTWEAKMRKAGWNRGILAGMWQHEGGTVFNEDEPFADSNGSPSLLYNTQGEYLRGVMATPPERLQKNEETE